MWRWEWERRRGRRRRRWSWGWGDTHNNDDDTMTGGETEKRERGMVESTVHRVIEIKRREGFGVKGTGVAVQII